MFKNWNENSFSAAWLVNDGRGVVVFKNDYSGSKTTTTSSEATKSSGKYATAWAAWGTTSKPAASKQMN